MQFTQREKIVYCLLLGVYAVCAWMLITGVVVHGTILSNLIQGILVGSFLVPAMTVSERRLNKKLSFSGKRGIVAFVVFMGILLLCHMPVVIPLIALNTPFWLFSLLSPFPGAGAVYLTYRFMGEPKPEIAKS